MTIEEAKQQWKEISIGRSTNYANQKFGKLTCLYRTENNSSGTVWVCKCECGNIKPFAISKLKKRQNPTCGCGLSLDLTGQRFGRLTAISKAPSRNGKTYWLCQCDCGNQKEIETCHLKEGTIRSCGCLVGNPINNLLKHQKNINEKRICEICGKEFILQPNSFTRKFCYNCVPRQGETLTQSEIVTIKRRAIKKALIEYKGGKCCRCGYNKCDRALEFHHLDSNKKDFGVANNMDKTIDKLKKEVDKCILVCSNCHAEIHEELDQI